MNFIRQTVDKVLAGGNVTPEEVYKLLDWENLDEVLDGAAEITRAFVKPVFDSCSIVNARSGKCSENCKWCAQSAHWKTNCTTYEIVGEEECMAEALHNHEKGVKRFSLVASGRAVKGEALDKICHLLRRAKEEVGISTCASLGLLDRNELQQLWDSGVHRYHCNLETAPSYFSKLCTTHTIEDKLRTIRMAREIGFEVCSGGIIGMGETPGQRVEFALTLREADPCSIPINILCPIPGTPLENSSALSREEILRTIALFRFIHPTKELRFAGGRQQLDRKTQIEAIRVGMNAGVVGDLLTTVGSQIDEDKRMIKEAGLEF